MNLLDDSKKIGPQCHDLCLLLVAWWIVVTPFRCIVLWKAHQTKGRKLLCSFLGVTFFPCCTLWLHSTAHHPAKGISFPEVDVSVVLEDMFISLILKGLTSMASTSSQFVNILRAVSPKSIAMLRCSRWCIQRVVVVSWLVRLSSIFRISNMLASSFGLCNGVGEYSIFRNVRPWNSALASIFYWRRSFNRVDFLERLSSALDT
jgi:hypothetical protein